jgi:hypothetical protein
MSIKLGDISPLAGAITGKGMFGKGLSNLADSGMGMLVPMSYLAQSQRKKALTRAEEDEEERKGRMTRTGGGMRKGGKVKKMAKGGSVSSASKRADGCATKGKTKGKMV